MMFLENLDQELLLAINGANNAFLDSFFWIVSGKLTWIPFYIFILLAILRNFPKRYGLIFTLLVVASVSLADLLSAQVIKENVARYRPSHHTELSEKLHFHVNDKGEEYRGGQYGFVSNHATNFAAIAFWVFIAFGRNNKRLSYVALGILLLVGYSRVYLGVHYPSDILGGIFVGFSISSLLYLLFRNKLNAAG